MQISKINEKQEKVIRDSVKIYAECLSHNFYILNDFLNKHSKVLNLDSFSFELWRIVCQGLCRNKSYLDSSISRESISAWQLNYKLEDIDKITNLSFDANEIRIFIKALDYYTKLCLGQLQEIAYVNRMTNFNNSCDYKTVEEILYLLKKLYWNFSPSASYSIFHADVKEETKIARDLEEQIKYYLALFEKREVSQLFLITKEPIIDLIFFKKDE